MHIPDGFLSPQTYLPATGLAIGAWIWAARELRARLDETLIPRLAVTTALAYVLNLVMLPLPGGTSAHFIGIALLALLFGARLAFLAFSGMLALQTFVLGAGGLTALPVNALILGLAAGLTARGSFALLARWREAIAIVVSTWLSVMVAATLTAVVLGIQPMIARRPDGAPLFFPFGLEVTLPAILLPHALIGIAEAALTLILWRYARARQWLS
ncbi:MAG: energy-coupling factor ABC transporter permease [Rhodocyclaceae bacterium]|nr:energy-coupling factor ABC transporter permease [Rhodocyclaceae bacterium]